MSHFLKTTRRIAIAAAVALASSSAFATPINVVTNGTFEGPTLAAGGYQYLAGSVNGWTYSGTSGLATNNSAFNVANATGQVAFLQQTSSISQSFTSVNSLFSLSFTAEARNWAQGANSFSVLLDGKALTFGTSTSLFPSSNNSFTQYNSTVTNLSAGTHTLSFVGYGVSNGDVTTFIDNVVGSANAILVPEPMSLSLFGLGLLALGITRRKVAK